VDVGGCAAVLGRHRGLAFQLHRALDRAEQLRQDPAVIPVLTTVPTNNVLYLLLPFTVLEIQI
jgi:hypothetical protein